MMRLALLALFLTLAPALWTPAECRAGEAFVPDTVRYVEPSDSLAFLKREARLDSVARAEAAARDSVAAAARTPKKATPKPKNSTAALLWSIIPGGGQIYNEAYWKLPIVVGIYTVCTYAISWNNAALTEYQNAYRDLMSDKPMENTSWQDFIPTGADPQGYITNSSFQEQLRRGRDYYRRYRDLSIIITVGMYFLVGLDAYVDAELSTFDISPDLSLRAAPAVLLPEGPPALSPDGSAGVGLSLALTF